MCGIAGIIYRRSDLACRLGADLAALIQPLESRGPDSSGMALYGDSVAAGRLKLVLRQGADTDWAAVQDWISRSVTVIDSQTRADDRIVQLAVGEDRSFQPDVFRTALKQAFPTLHVMSLGQSLEIHKEVGAVNNLIEQYGLIQFAGSHGIAHTRMATESVVDIDHCHPFTTGVDLSLVHNGQISNYYRLRFQLERAGLTFDTQNDSEAIANYIHYQLLQGKTLEAGIRQLMTDIDGTYTFLVATPEKVALVRDKFAAKPAVIYETADYVAIASEYRALLNLPDFDPNATIREPDAGEINIWSVTAPAAAPVQLSAVGG